MRTRTVDLHGHDVLTALDLAEQRVREAYANGYEAIELLHGAGDVAEPVESGRGRIKWALRQMVEDGSLRRRWYPGLPPQPGRSSWS